MVEEVGQQTTEILARTGQFIEQPEGRCDVALENGVDQLHELGPCGQTEHGKHIGLDDPVAAETDELVQGGLGIPHAAVGSAGDGQQSVRIDRHLLLLRDPGQMLDDQGCGNPPQIEALTAAEDRRQHLLGIRGREEELHVRWRLLERLEQRVEGGRREHVHLVDDVDLELARGRGEFGGIPQFPDLVDTIVRGTVDLEHIEGTPLGDLLHPRVGIIELGAGTSGAVQRLGEDPSQGGLAGSPGTTEEVAMGDPPQSDGVGQGGGHVFLTHHIGKTLGTVFSGDDLVTHGWGTIEEPSAPLGKQTAHIPNGDPGVRSTAQG